MHLARLRAVGGSVMFAIPRAILESLDLAPDRSVGLSVSDGRLIIDPHPRPRYTLANLVEQCDASAPLTGEERQWLESPPVGREEF
jgi:antitoxin ChpS